jgi:hypothetical protein
MNVVEDDDNCYLRVKMVLVSKVMQRWNELCISRNRRYCTGEEIHILEECTMTPVKLLAYHLYVRCISFNNNPAPYKKKKKRKRKQPIIPTVENKK